MFHLMWLHGLLAGLVPGLVPLPSPRSEEPDLLATARAAWAEYLAKAKHQVSALAELPRHGQDSTRFHEVSQQVESGFLAPFGLGGVYLNQVIRSEGFAVRKEERVTTAQGELVAVEIEYSPGPTVREMGPLKTPVWAAGRVSMEFDVDMR